MSTTNLNITKSFTEDHFYNEPIYETPNFKVIPSLGSMIEGWLLIIPKKHYISIGQISNESLYNELQSLINAIGSILKKEYGEYLIFEHGAVENKTDVGCGVDYAHVHIIPVNINLIEGANKLSTDVYTWQEIPNIEYTQYYYNEGLSYLYYQNYLGKSFIGINENIPSQLFRKVIARHLGIEEKFDWKENYFLNNINKTIKTFSAYSLNIFRTKPLNYE